MCFTQPSTNAKFWVMLVHCVSDHKNFLTPNGQFRNLNAYVYTVMEVFGKSSYSTFTLASEVAQYTFSWLLIGQTPSSIPPKIIIVTICMTNFLAVFVCDKCKFMDIFGCLLFPQSHPCPTGKGYQSQKRILNTSRDSCLQFGTLFEKIEALDHFNKME